MVSRIKVARVEQGMNQFELAKRLGCSESQISRYETGRAPLGPDILRRIAGALEVDACRLDPTLEKVEEDEA